MRFLLNSADAELLTQFELTPSLDSLSRALGRDPTVISRQLKRISECGDFLTKVAGRWKLTESGEKMNQLTRDYILAQNKVIQNKVHLRIGATREFAARILGNHYDSLKKALGVSSISIISLENGVESALLKGEIDIGFDCGRPYSPDISFKLILDEPICPVVSKKQFKNYKDIKRFKNLEELPHILCQKLQPENIFKSKFLPKNIVTTTNDIATARSLCLSSQGWALLPIYAIKEELKSGQLKRIANTEFTGTKFGVHYLRSRKNLTLYFHKLDSWMSQMDTLLQ